MIFSFFVIVNKLSHEKTKTGHEFILSTSIRCVVQKLLKHIRETLHLDTVLHYGEHGWCSLSVTHQRPAAVNTQYCTKSEALIK